MWRNEVREETSAKWDDIRAIKNRIGRKFGDLWNELDFTPTCRECGYLDTNPKPDSCDYDLSNDFDGIDPIEHEYMETVVYWEKAVALSQHCEQNDCPYEEGEPDPLPPSAN